MKLPIPRWLIPLPLVRWALTKIVTLIYPLFIILNECFDSTPFAQCVQDDEHSFYSAVARSVRGFARECGTAPCFSWWPPRPGADFHLF